MWLQGPLCTLLTLSVLVSADEQQPYTVTPGVADSEVVFEKQADVHLFSNPLRLAIPVASQQIATLLSIMTSVVGKLAPLQATLANSSSVPATTHDKTIQDLKTAHNNLLHQLSVSQNLDGDSAVDAALQTALVTLGTNLRSVYRAKRHAPETLLDTASVAAIATPFHPPQTSEAEKARLSSSGSEITGRNSLKVKRSTKTEFLALANLTKNNLAEILLGKSDKVVLLPLDALVISPLFSTAAKTPKRLEKLIKGEKIQQLVNFIFTLSNLVENRLPYNLFPYYDAISRSAHERPSPTIFNSSAIAGEMATVQQTLSSLNYQIPSGEITTLVRFPHTLLIQDNEAYHILDVPLVSRDQKATLYQPTKINVYHFEGNTLYKLHPGIKNDLLLSSTSSRSLTLTRDDLIHHCSYTAADQLYCRDFSLRLHAQSCLESLFSHDSSSRTSLCNWQASTPSLESARLDGNTYLLALSQPLELWSYCSKDHTTQSSVLKPGLNKITLTQCDSLYSPQLSLNRLFSSASKYLTRPVNATDIFSKISAQQPFSAIKDRLMQTHLPSVAIASLRPPSLAQIFEISPEDSVPALMSFTATSAILILYFIIRFVCRLCREQPPAMFRGRAGTPVL